MSDPVNQQSIISKYNFSRRVVDHRYPHDLNHAINKAPLTPQWYSAVKNQFISRMVQNFSIYTSIYALFGCFGLAVWDAYCRDSTDNKSGLFKSRQQYGQRFIFNHKNENTDLGRWNHNFHCFEKEPNCGRDFDIYKEE